MEEMDQKELVDDPFLQVIFDAVKESEKKTRIINPIRYLELLRTKKAVDDLLDQNGETELSSIRFHHAFSSASISAEVEMLEIHDMRKLCDAAKNASNIELYPLTNGKIRVALTFQKVLIPID